VALLTGARPDQMSRLAGGDLSEVLLVRRDGAPPLVAKSGAAANEAHMLRALAGAGVPAPMVEGEFGDVLLIEHVEADGVLSPRAWADIGAQLRRLHDQQAETYGWPVDHAFGSVKIDNRQGSDWPAFWGEQRLIETAALLDRPWRERIDQVAARLPGLLPAHPPASLLHGDLWSGNILVREGRLAALIDPACYHGDGEVDLAMISLFDAPPDEFWSAYGKLAEGWRARRPLYQLFPALVHLRLFGAAYAPMVDRLLIEAGA
jgi:fructosamine-3-kinase